MLIRFQTKRNHDNFYINVIVDYNLDDCKVSDGLLMLLDSMSHTFSSALLPPVTSLTTLLLDDGITDVPSRQAMQVMYSLELSVRVVIRSPSQRECTKLKHQYS